MAGSLTPASVSTASATGFVVDADRVSVTPTGQISSTDVQAALAELDSEKAPTGNLALTVSSTDVVLTEEQFANNSFDITGTLTASINIIVPDGIAHNLIVDNATSGAFTVTVKHAATAGVVVPQGTKVLLYTNGTTIEGVDAIGGGGSVTSVFSRTGDVVATSGDYTAAQVTNTPAGGIAATTVQAAINELDTEKAATGANSDITSLSGLTTALSIGQGGTGQTTAQAAINALSQVSAATDEYVLTKDTATGNALWKASAGGANTDLSNLSATGQDKVITAWASWDSSSGTPTILDSFNVASLTDNGVGKTAVNFSATMNNANFAVTGNARSTAAYGSAVSITSVSTALAETYLYYGSTSAGIDSAFNYIQVTGGM